MFYYEIAIGGKNRGNHYYFTYSSESELAVGCIVNVHFRKKSALGFIVKKSSKPDYKTLAIDDVLPLKIPRHLVCVYLALCDRYPLSGQLLARLFLPNSSKIYTVPALKSDNHPMLPDLNDEQKIITDDIRLTMKNTFLFGDTGTGKTRMYMHIIDRVLRSGKNVILLEPEIGLSTFIYSEVVKYFPRALLYHSQLTPKERQIAWQTAHNSHEGLLIVGPRSALTLPINNLGLVIMDEAHDGSYRQDNAPYIHAQDIVSQLVRAVPQSYFVYGSATPNVADMYFAKTLGMPIHRITTPAVNIEEPKKPITISPKSDQEKTTSHLLLKTSRETLKKTFASSHQAMILVNRRGTARLVRCETCGHEMTCPTCGHLFVYHHDTHKLHCHFCLSKVPMMSVCPECHGSEISMVPFGTKALQLEVEKLYPNVSAMRFDTDSSKKDHLSQHVDELTRGEIQCIIGTQMVAKGLDLPLLKSLIVLEGTSGSGFMSEERQFQLLYQVLGRARRGHQAADIVIQTHNLESPYLVHAMNRDYDSFYDSEIQEREKFLYPPFCYVMAIHYSRKSSASAMSAGTKLVQKLKQDYSGIDVTSPLPNMTEKIRSDYNWHILIKSKKRSTLARIASDIGTSWLCELDPLNLP